MRCASSFQGSIILPRRYEIFYINGISMIFADISLKQHDFCEWCMRFLESDVTSKSATVGISGE